MKNDFLVLIVTKCHSSWCHQMSLYSLWHIVQDNSDNSVKIGKCNNYIVCIVCHVLCVLCVKQDYICVCNNAVFVSRPCMCSSVCPWHNALCHLYLYKYPCPSTLGRICLEWFYFKRTHNATFTSQSESKCWVLHVFIF